MSQFRSALITLGLALATAASAHSAESELLATVQQFVDAFNARSADKMLALCRDDFRWYFTDHEKTQIVTDGKAALAESLARDFAQPMSVTSSIVSSQLLGNFVSVVEKASWQGRDGEQQQCSIALYEFADGLIKGVWYYPAQPC